MKHETLSLMLRYAAPFLFALCALVGTASAVNPAPGPGELVVVNMSNNRRFTIPLDGARSFAIRFFHSYDRDWVEERFLIEPRGFVPSEARYASDSYDYHDTRYQGRASVGPSEIRLKVDKVRERDVLRSIVTRVAYTRPQRLIVFTGHGAVTYLFTAWGEPGRQIRIGAGTL